MRSMLKCIGSSSFGKFSMANSIPPELGQMGLVQCDIPGEILRILMGRFNIVADARHRAVDFVGDPGNQLAQGCQFFLLLRAVLGFVIRSMRSETCVGNVDHLLGRFYRWTCLQVSKPSMPSICTSSKIKDG